MKKRVVDQLTIKEANELGYSPAKILLSGECAGVRNMIYTVALCVGLDEFCYRTRFCYETRAEAETALAGWDGTGDPPGPWIKEKGAVERLRTK